MVVLAILVITAGCAAYQYFKGTLVTAFATIVNAVFASFIAFGFFELTASFLAKYLAAIADWAQLICFAMLFLIPFAVFQTAIPQALRHKVDLGLWPERIGRSVCGVVLGYIVSGLLLTAAAMAPLPNAYPYQRFDQRNPDSDRPDRVALNADGFTTGLFSLASNGSFRAISNRRSFAALHPAFLDQLFLNRHSISDVPVMTSEPAIEVPAKAGSWYAGESVRDSEGKPLSPRPGHSLIMVRIGIKRSSLSDAGKFTLSQLRVVCRPKNDKNTLAGKGRNVYPIGYLTAPNQLQPRKLNEKIEVQGVTETVKWIDFAFYVPVDFIPVVAEFKLNNIADVPAPVSAEQAPAQEFFGESAQPQQPSTQPQEPNQPTKPRNPEERKRSPRRGGLSNVSKGVVGDQLGEN